MLLRNTLEHVLPVRDNESRLSKEARKVLLKGYSIGYLNPMHARWSDSKVSSTEYDKPFVHDIRGWDPGGVDEGGHHFLLRKDLYAPSGKLLHELKENGVRARADRVQTIARSIKLSSAMLLASAGIYFGVTDGVFASLMPAGGSYQDISDCSQSIDGNQTLVPIEGSQIDAAQASGEGVCRLNGYDYEFQP